MLLHKMTTSKEPALNDEIASKMLENIFDACDMEHNSVPLEVLTSYSNYRKERFLLQKIVLVFILLLFCLLPLLFVTADVSVSPNPDSRPGQPAYEIRVDALLPVERITASIDGQTFPVYAAGESTYSVDPPLNGTMDIVVVLKNRQSTAIQYEVEGVDRDAPEVISHLRDGAFLYLYLEDSGSGVDYAQIKALDPDGNEVSPSSYDEEAGYVEFAYPSSSLNVYIPDKTGNQLHLILTVK